ncbi:octopamine receptor Oamb-like [Paramacrobiotus metropolitanus]|uniref:octopamine receptor Oamb-like n=1 Tax=Paramacrobiotus metropolitanus TaxID=2943436 RepID=UPI002445A8DE|nr:octopamine receptor Oamb-like [Paramacrobiotus metropolitanus]
MSNATNATDWAVSIPIGGLVLLDTTVSIFWSFVANLIILGAVFIDPHLQRHSNFYGVSLAVSDVLGTANLGFGCYDILYNRWVIQSPGLCKFWVLIDYTMSLTGSLSICLISYDRYKMVFHPRLYAFEESSNRAVLRILFVWLVSFAFYIPVCLFWDYFVGYSVIAADDCDPEFRDVLWMTIVLSVVEFFLPFFLIVYFNVRLIFAVNRRAKRLVEVKKKLGEGPLSSLNFPVHSTDHEAREEEAFERNRLNTEAREIASAKGTTKSVLILVGVFAGLWLPWEFIGNFVIPICDDCVPLQLYQFAFWLQYHTYVVNAIVFGLTVERFRDYFRKVYRMIVPKKDKRVRFHLSTISVSPEG